MTRFGSKDGHGKGKGMPGGGRANRNIGGCREGGKGEGRGEGKGKGKGRKD